MLILFGFAFLAGIVTVLSPCILPILPVLLAAGTSSGKQRSFGIIMGLVLSFTFFTLTLSALVRTTGISPNILRYGAIILIILFGLTMILPMLSAIFARITRSIAHIGSRIQDVAPHIGSGFFSGFVVGIALGLLWTPCAGPILATIITVVATQTVTGDIIALTLVYSLGAAIPLFLVTYASKKMLNSTRLLAHYSESIRMIFGVLMIIGALAIAFHWDVILQQWTLSYFPSLSIEHNTLVQKELTTLTHAQKDAHMKYDNGIHAPEFAGIAQWINSPALSIKALRNKVVLIDFWTYSCINCIRTLPHIKHWYEQYHDKGLVIIGVHTPEFEFEKNKENVQAAVERFTIPYPVALDNEYKTWLAYDNHYWPAHYLINQEGLIVDTHFGEGNYRETENAIRALLGLEPLTEITDNIPYRHLTPETYLGFERAHSYQEGIQLNTGKTESYHYTGPVTPDTVGLQGLWRVDNQSITAMQDNAELTLSFTGTNVYLVMESPTPALVTLLLDGKPLSPTVYTDDMNAQGALLVQAARMYHLVNLKAPSFTPHLLTIHASKDMTLYAFTFGDEKD